MPGSDLSRLYGPCGRSRSICIGWVGSVVVAPRGVGGLLVAPIYEGDRRAGGIRRRCLISAVAFDLVPEAEVLVDWQLALWFLAGALIFVVADNFVERKFGAGDEGGGPLGIVVGPSSTGYRSR